MMDNVNDLTHVPLQVQRDNLQNKRRIGLGIMGLGSALMMRKLRYGSKEAVEETEKLITFITNRAYQASAVLAKEKTAFPLYDKDAYLASEFIERLDNETQEMIAQHGIRNSHLTSIQPTGNTSILSNVVSGGLEPVFMHQYIRTAQQPYPPEGLTTPEAIDWTNRTYSGSDNDWQWIQEGDTPLLRIKHEGKVWKIDQSRGLLKEELVEDYAVRHMKESGEWDSKANWAVTTSDLSVKDHVKMMKPLSTYIDSAMSKCIVEGTLIHTTRGIIPIEQLGPEKQADSFSKINEDIKVLDAQGEEQNMVQHYYGGEKQCYKIRFSNGFELKAAWTHKLKTNKGWVNLLDIEPGDKVFFRQNNICIHDEKSEYVKLPQPNFYNCIKRRFPDKLTPEYAKFLGAWLGDGFVSISSIGLCEKDDSCKKLYPSLMKSVFGVEPKLSLDSRTGVRTHIIHSRALVRYFKKHYGHNCATKKIPSELLQSPKEVLKSFLEGISVDGYLDKRANKIILYDGYSKDIAVKTSYILSALNTSYYLGRKKVEGGTSPYSYSIAARFEEKVIDPIEKHKQVFSTQGKKQIPRLVTHKENYNKLPPTSHHYYYKYRNLRKSLKKNPWVREEILEDLNIPYDKDLTYVEVTDKKFIGKKKVYDIEVEGTHSYLINGIVSHNTINLPEDYPYEDFKNLYIDMYKTGVIKGGTTYRAGTMTTVLAATNEDNQEGIPHNNAAKRPKRLPCDIHKVRAEGGTWRVLVGMYGDDPYEVFAFKTRGIHLTETKGVLEKNGGGKYNLYDKTGENIIIEDIADKFESDEQEALTRMISGALRHGKRIQYVVEQLDKSPGTVVSFNKALSRVLSKYTTDVRVDSKKQFDCDRDDCQIVREEGCIKCNQCGESACT